ncbi:hypothetical protein M409DRAFT_27670 [Zasmidium cellare ATCC 36951]|uniref:Uncharacterized protein n=1 Tax=Zasmidium cellare ATCC 36951 TaxID=1080233 RepID=A0A6A6C4U5_ZASCE|nr:uncharacterized protein M409DRAFT_27670 [Zasmidium cellare ATCC 36951]KAF2161943.1 hypothetical protein M409DRAFT_27670 [Zasmidium cellare ATCC 36951]
MRFTVLSLAALACGTMAHSSEGSGSTTTTTTTITTAVTTTTTTVTLPCSSSSIVNASSIINATTPAQPPTSSTSSPIPSTSSVQSTGLTTADASVQCTAIISPPPASITETAMVPGTPGINSTRTMVVDGSYCTCGPRIAGMNITTIGNTAYTVCADLTKQTVGSSVVDATAPVASSTSQLSAAASLTGTPGTSAVNGTVVSPTSPTVSSYTGAAMKAGCTAQALALGAIGAAFAVL